MAPEHADGEAPQVNATTSVKLKHLWPGDVVECRPPGALTGKPCRIVYLVEKMDGSVRVGLADGERMFSVSASRWDDAFELYVHGVAR